MYCLRVLWLCLALCFDVISVAAQGELPPVQSSTGNRPVDQTPEGYTWHSCDLMNAQFLVPPDWHFLAAEKGGTAACFITKEEIFPSGEFETGITINQLTDIPGKRGVPPQQFAEQMAQYLAKSRTVVRQGTQEGDPFIATGLEVLDSTPDGVKMRTYYLWLSNPTTGTVYLIFFEARAEEWEQNWALVAPVYQTLALDDKQ